MTRALLQPVQISQSHAHKIRSTLTSLGRDAERCKTPSWWRRARISSLRAARPRNEATSEATSAANSGPHGESKEERQLLIYQEDRSLREPQSGFEIHSVTHSTTCMGGKPGILRMLTVHER